MVSDEIWKKATTQKSLETGWHLTRAELRAGFFFDFFHQQAIAQNLHPQLKEIKRLLDTNTYRFRPLRQVPIPKGPLSTRPGSHLPLRDRIVFWSIVKHIAPIFDEDLSSNVYSYRLKENPKKGELFKEGDALSIPFLKKQQISQELDPFEPWYGAWPDFEERTEEEIGAGYRYMVVSDIAGYFENINIDILKDQVISRLDNEPKLSNFISSGFIEWVNVTQHGFRPRRSIPQGSGISSFFGKIYLIPIDNLFNELMIRFDIKYIRYMDDIRIFTKNLSDARMSIFALEKSVRELHLNLQSSKTKILEELSTDKQITHALFDDRVDRIATIRNRLEKDTITSARAAKALETIARAIPTNPNSQRLIGVKNPKSDLTDRAMRAWMNTCITAGSRDYISTLLRQFPVNPDARLSRIFVNSCRAFPRINSLGEAAINFIRSADNIHPHQEAELIRGCRYLSNIPDDIWHRALENALKIECSFQLKAQSLLLLGMRPHSKSVMMKLFNQMENDQNVITQPYYFSVLGQMRLDEREALVSYYSYHANQHNQEFGLLLKLFDKNYSYARSFIKHVFSNDVQITDWQGMIFFMANSENAAIKSYLLYRIRDRLKHGGRTMLKKRLAAARNLILEGAEK